MKYTLLALFIAIFTFSAKAQKMTFESGYIVNLKGDTTRGEIKYNPEKEQDCYSKVAFKDLNGVLKTYKPNKAMAYGFGDKHFIAYNFESEPKFLRVLAAGAINFYKIMFDEISMNKTVVGGEYFISQKSDPGDMTGVKETKFKKQIGEWMKDNPELVNNYPEEKVFNEANATELIKKYNAWKANK